MGATRESVAPIGLVVTDLEAQYGRAKILRGVNLTVGTGELVGLAGRNGAGKSTTLRALSGVMTRRGRLALDGVELPASPQVCARRGLIHVPERRGIFPSITVEENLRLGAIAAGQNFEKDNLERVLSSFPKLRELLKRPSGLLSGGEQQMMAIARGLMANPRLLLIDELSLGLSPRATSDIAQALLSACLDRGVSMLLVDQNVRMLTAVCDRLYLLSEGRTTEIGGDDETEIQRAATAIYFESS